MYKSTLPIQVLADAHVYVRTVDACGSDGRAQVHQYGVCVGPPLAKEDRSATNRQENWRGIDTRTHKLAQPKDGQRR